MDGIHGNGGLTSSLSIAAGAMQTHATSMQICAHNIANISTVNFLPQKVQLTTGPNDQGVLLASVTKETGVLGGKPASPGGKLDGKPNITTDPVRSEKEIMHPSGTELAYEVPHMITTQHAYEANAKTITAIDDMLGSLLNIST